MTPMKNKLTKALVDKAEPTPLGDIWLWDADLDGFGLRIRPTGRKTYVIRYRTAQGTQRKQTIANSNVMTPEKARELARKEFSKVAEGKDPMAERAPTSGPTRTVGGMFQAYVDNMRAKKRVSAGEVERALLLAKDNAADALGRDKPAGTIESGAVVDYLAKFFKAGHRGAADKHRGYIASAYTWAMRAAHDYTSEHRQDWGITRNPATDVPKDAGANGTRDRNLSAAELRSLWSGTDGATPGFMHQTATCIRLLICCGQRVQETLRLDGNEIDFQAKLWRMPAHKTKGGKLPHVIPLPEQIIPDLLRLVQRHGAGSLFPARPGSGDLVDHRSVMQALGRWSERNGIADFQTRDLRRTWKSRAHDAGVDRFTRDLIQQHAQLSDTGSKHYDRADYLPQMVQAMTKWEDWLTVNVTSPAVPAA